MCIDTKQALCGSHPKTPAHSPQHSWVPQLVASSQLGPELHLVQQGHSKQHACMLSVLQDCLMRRSQKGQMGGLDGAAAQPM